MANKTEFISAVKISTNFLKALYLAIKLRNVRAYEWKKMNTMPINTKRKFN